MGLHIHQLRIRKIRRYLPIWFSFFGWFSRKKRTNYLKTVDFLFHSRISAVVAVSPIKIVFLDHSRRRSVKKIGVNDSLSSPSSFLPPLIGINDLCPLPTTTTITAIYYLSFRWRLSRRKESTRIPKGLG